MSGWLGYLATAAFLAGIAGGVHCAAMCGPLLAACAGGGSRLSRPRQALGYNAGRLLSYAAAGAIAGALGSVALALHGGASAASALAALSGTAMLLLALHIGGCTAVTRGLEAAGGAVWRRLGPRAGRFVPVDTFGRAFGLGALWGWLPCGMVYGALVTAAAAASAGEGALVMLAFGLGTLPNVLGITFAAGRLKSMLHLKAVRLLAAGVTAGLGVLGLSFAVHAHPYTVGGVICRWVPAAASFLQ